MVQEPAPHPLRLVQRIRHGDSYVLLLGLIFLDYLALSLADPAHEGDKAITALVTGVTLLSALRTSHVHPAVMRGAQLLVLAVLALALANVWLHSAAIGKTVGIGFAVLLFATPPTILRRIYHHQVITVETLAGAVDVYLLVGLVFASVYSAANFIAPPFFVQTATPSGDQFVYFSYVTLATLGYGDLTPAASLGRTLVVIETLLGQVYLVTVVARLVALFTTAGRR